MLVKVTIGRRLRDGSNQHKLIANPSKLDSVVAAMAPDLTRNGDVVRSQAALDVQNIHTAVSRAWLHCSDEQAALIAWQIMSAATGSLVSARLMGSKVGARIDAAVVVGTQHLIGAH